MKKIKNLMKFSILIILASSIFYYIYLLEIQIELLTLKIKNLTSLIDVLKANEIEMRNQLLLKNHQLELLTHTINQLKTDMVNLNENYNLELFRNEVLKANAEEWAILYFSVAKIVATSAILILLGITFKKIFFTEVIELRFVDSVNKLMWFVRVPDENRKIDLFVKRINPDLYEDQAAECIKTLVLKTPESFFAESSDYINIGLVGASTSASERMVAASQISDMLSSAGVS